MKRIVITILVTTLLVTVLTAIIMKNSLNKVLREVEPITITKTIIEPKFDTIYHSHYDTIKVKTIQTDTLIEHHTDSILIQLPINNYIIDTTITDTTSITSLEAHIKGFNVTVDSLLLKTKIIPEIKENNVRKSYRIKDKIGVGVGIGYGTGGVGMMVGIMYKIN